MANKIANVNKINSGLCPHGLPPSACPICSNAAGSMKQSDRNRKLGEMTYHECAMIGNMLKARALAQKNHEANLKHREENLKVFENNLVKMAEKMAEFAKQISQNFIMKPVAFVIQNIAIPIINTVKNIVNFVNSISEKINLIKQKVFDIMDKLTAIFGELKAFIDKKVSEFISTIKSKFTNLFKIFKKENAKDDDTKIDEDKKIFNLKKIIRKLLGKKDDNDEQSSKNK